MRRQTTMCGNLICDFESPVTAEVMESIGEQLGPCVGLRLLLLRMVCITDICWDRRI